MGARAGRACPPRRERSACPAAPGAGAGLRPPAARRRDGGQARAGRAPAGGPGRGACGARARFPSQPVAEHACAARSLTEVCSLVVLCFFPACPGGTGFTAPRSSRPAAAGSGSGARHCRAAAQRAAFSRGRRSRKSRSFQFRAYRVGALSGPFGGAFTMFLFEAGDRFECCSTLGSTPSSLAVIHKISKW